MSARNSAVELASKRAHIVDSQQKTELPLFNCHVFTPEIMQQMLPKDVCENLHRARLGKEKIRPEFADSVAHAMSEWAIDKGATHYCHWFQPLTGATAEKHESFVDWKTEEVCIDKFSGKELLQGEPDASSFPSGGLRSTYEARGYTGWDPSSPVFVWEAGDGLTLFIPSIFFSWTGDVLDNKIPLLRSDKKINDAVLRLLKLTGFEASQVYSTLGWEQEYFVIDRALRDLRPDLVILGRTVFGAPPTKGQELQDHYFGSVKDRVLSYMKDFEDAALKLGIPVKTRHNEVAPAQHEVAPVFEKASVAVDHNIILMELMRRIAIKHDLSCLLHEKPFNDLNGSGKHNNWSLSTDTGYNLLDPADSPENSLQFLILITSIIVAIHKHAALVRASIGSAGNDHRLGGHEAPPAIISIYMGSNLEALLNQVIKEGDIKKTVQKSHYNFGITSIPELTKDHTDRNRTSPFAFTGNKFEYRAVGSSTNCALPITVLNVVVAESLHEIVDAIEIKLGGQLPTSQEELSQVALPILQQYLIQAKPILFSGDNYSEEWKQEAAKRKLPNIEKSFDAFATLKEEQTWNVFKDVLSKEELLSRYDVAVDVYSQHVSIEGRLMVDLFQTQILPAAMTYQRKLAQSVQLVSDQRRAPKMQKKYLDKLVDAIEKSLSEIESLETALNQANDSSLSREEQGRLFASDVSNKIKTARLAVDQLEELVDDKLWPLSKYRELLFLI